MVQDKEHMLPVYRVPLTLSRLACDAHDWMMSASISFPVLAFFPLLGITCSQTCRLEFVLIEVRCLTRLPPFRMSDASGQALCDGLQV